MTLLKKISLLLFFLAVGVYALYQARYLLAGPVIEVLEPLSGSAVDSDEIHVRGAARNITKLFLNGQQIFTDSAGRFDEEVLLAYGYNIVELRAEDKFQRAVKRELHLVLK